MSKKQNDTKKKKNEAIIIIIINPASFRTSDWPNMSLEKRKKYTTTTKQKSARNIPY